MPDRTNFNYLGLSLSFIYLVSLSTASVVATGRWTIPVPVNSTLTIPSHSLPGPVFRQNANLVIPPRTKVTIVPSPVSQVNPVMMMVHPNPPALFIPKSVIRRRNFQNRLNALKLSFMRMFDRNPKADRRALNLNQFYDQFKRGKENAMALYSAMVEAHERRLLQDPSSIFQEKDGDGPTLDLTLMQDRKVKGMVGRIIGNFIGDCVGVVISEVFRKTGEIAGEFARFIVSQAAETIMGADMMSKSKESQLTMSKLIPGLSLRRSSKESVRKAI